MSTAHGHTLRPLTEDEIAQNEKWDADRPRRWYSTCKRPRCTEPARWAATWRHVTGRQGRVGTKHMNLCDRHAEQFRVRHSPSGTSPSGVISPATAAGDADNELL